MTAQDAPATPLLSQIDRPGKGLRDSGEGEEALKFSLAPGQQGPRLSEADLLQLHGVHDGAPDIVLAIDEGERVAFANTTVSEVLGWVPDEIRGMSIASLIGEGKEIECVSQCVHGREPLRDTVLPFLSSGGAWVDLSVSSGSWALGPRSAPHVLLYARDIGERLAREAELVRTNNELEHCVNALAHDLRSPLVALLGFSRLLRQDYDALFDETARHFLDRIEQAGCTMEALVHDLLELSRIGRPSHPRMLVDPRPVLIQIEAELKPRLDSGGIELILPEDPPMLLCDRTPLYQVFSNLIGNAVEHACPESDGKIWVDIQGGVDSHHLTVRDTGCGIPEENRERIFEAFQSFSPTPEKRRGAGIGLAIVKKIVESHDGRVWVESAPGAGSTFHATFPSSPINR